MSVLRHNRSLLLLTLIAAVALVFVTSALAAPENIDNGPGDWGGTAGNPDDWGKPQPSGWLAWFVDALRVVSIMNVYWGAW